MERKLLGQVPLMPQLCSYSSGSDGVSVHFEDHGDVWQFVLPGLEERLPLRNITWKNHLQVTKTIERLHVNFYQVYTQAQLLKHPTEMTTAGSPGLVFIFVVKCEDLTTYKAKIKPSLSAWVDRMNLMKNEWLILYVPLGTQATTGLPASSAAARGLSAFGQAFRDSSKVYRKILDRLKTDFGDKNDKLDRICKIEVLEGNTVAGAAPGQQQQHQAQWSELLIKLKSCIMEAFDARCCEYEEQLRLLDGKRALTGWDFSSFFQIKESLALLYIQASLHDEALRHYDELEATFTTISEAQQDALQELPELDAMDSIFSTTPFDINMTTVRMNIAVNAASPLYIRLYLFCRQVAILHTMHKHEAVIQRSLVFLPQFMQLLQQLEIPSALPLQWAIGAALAVFVTCEDELHQYKSTNPTPEPSSISLALADLLYLARRVWRKLPRTATRNPSKHWYFVCLESESLHEITYWASVNYANAGRHRMAAFLGSQCAQYSKTPSTLLLKQVEQLEHDRWWDLLEVATLALYEAYMTDAHFENAANLCLHWLQLEHFMRRISPKNLHIHHLWIDTLKKCNPLDLHWNSNVIEVLPTSELAMPKVLLRVKNCLLGPIHLDLLRIAFQREDIDSCHISNHEDNGMKWYLIGLKCAAVVVSQNDIDLPGNESTEITLTIDPSMFAPGNYCCHSIICTMANQSFHLDLLDEQLMQFQVAPQFQSSLALHLMPKLRILPSLAMTTWEIHIDTSEDIVLDGKLTLETNSMLEFNASSSYIRQDGASKQLSGEAIESRKLMIDLPQLSQPADIIVGLSTNDPGSALVDATLSYSYTRSSQAFVYAATRQATQTLHIGSMVLFNQSEVTCKPIDDKLFIQVPLRCNALLPLTLEPSSSELLYGSTNLFQTPHSSVQVLFNPMSEISTTCLQVNESFYASFSLRIDWNTMQSPKDLTYRIFYSIQDSCRESMDIPIALTIPIAPSKPQWTLQVKSFSNEAVCLGTTVRFHLEFIPKDQQHEEACLWIALHPKCSSEWLLHGRASYALSAPYTITVGLMPLRCGVCQYPRFDVRMGHREGKPIQVHESVRQIIVM